MRPSRLGALCVWLVGGAAHAQESALAAARAATHTSPNDPSAALALGRTLRRAGHLPESLAELRRGAATFSGRQTDIAAKLHWEIARTFIAQRDFPSAMLACRLAAAQTGGVASGHVCAAEAYLLWRRASDALPEATLAGRTYDARLALGRAYAMQLKDADAEAAFKDAMTLQPTAAEPHLFLGRFWVETQRLDPGIAELKRAVELDPADPDALYELGRASALAALARPDPAVPFAEAAVLLEKATHERPSFVDAWTRLADADLALGKNADARAAAQAAIRLNTQEPSPHVVMGRVALADGKVEDAIAEARAALGLVATSAPAKFLLADGYAQKGEIDLALEQYQAASGLDRQNPDILVHAALACVKAGRLTSARAFGQAVTRDFPTWAPGWIALGDALAADGDSAGARAAYDKGLVARGPLDATAVRRKIAALR